MSYRTALAVMARYPAVGAVKTRLARTLGSVRATALYRAFLRDIELRFTAGPRRLVWAFDPPDSDFRAIVAAGARCLPQAGADLGARMHHCFRTLHGEGFERVIMLGADIPHVRDEWLDEAEDALSTHDIVLGPTHDGGYYLIAMRAAHDVFSDIEMSTNHVLADTLAKAARAGLRAHLLPATFDIDEESDLMQLRELLACDRSMSLPNTAAVLAKGDDDE